MSLLPTNKNEATYVGGKKHFRDVLKNDSTTDTLIYRLPEEDFNYGSTLVVMPGEQAIFVNQGNIEQVFKNGTYPLETANLPFISRLRNSLTGGVSAFNCVVYFVRTATSREIRWGTESALKVYDDALTDPVTGIGVETEVRAHGAYRVKVSDPPALLTQLIGSNYDMWNQSDLTDFFRSQFLSQIMQDLSSELNALVAPLNTAPSHQLDFSRKISESLRIPLAEYGLELLNFSIAGLTIVDNEERRRLQKEAGKRRDLAYSGQAEALRYQALGTNYQQSQMLGMLRDAAQNEGAGASMMNAGVGLAMGAGLGQTFAEAIQQQMPSVTQEFNQAAETGSKQSDVKQSGATRSMSDTDTRAGSANSSVTERLKQLKELNEAGLISDSDFETRKSEILKEI